MEKMMLSFSSIPPAVSERRDGRRRDQHIGFHDVVEANDELE
jgi:hypothetical protein